MTLVRISNGAIRGKVENGVYAFKGIPYAEPVGGPARWLPPTPRASWDGVLDVLDYGPACMQFNGSVKVPLPFPAARRRYLEAVGGSMVLPEGDDSLLLNVWSPSVDPGTKLPVMVWLHGGGFTAGAANAVYDGTPFARANVVIVVIQYRLGPPGFLHGSGLFDGEVCTDNRGLLDQVAALRWVQENIGVFGGDASRVTLFGESAGAFAIYQLAASPLAKGLFHRAIAMGGMAGTCAPAEEHHALARDLLQDIGVKAGDHQALAALDKSRLMKLQSAMRSRIFTSKDPGRYGSLSRDKVAYLGAASGTPFLPQSPLATYPAGTPNDIDLILGTCQNDGQLFSFIVPLWQSLSARLFSAYLTGLMPNGDLAAVRDFYRREMPHASRGRRDEQINNDAFYRMPTIQAAEAHAAGNPGKTYLYQLNYASAIPGLRAVHAIDVALMFRTAPIRQLLAEDEETAALSAIMIEAFTRFAATGRPRAAGMPEWLAFNQTSRYSMALDRRCTLESDPDGHLRRYWSQPSTSGPKAGSDSAQTRAPQELRPSSS